MDIQARLADLYVTDVRVVGHETEDEFKAEARDLISRGATVERLARALKARQATGEAAGARRTTELF